MRLWRALENIQGWAGVRSVWREHMGDELQFLEPLLSPIEELAMSVPWPGTIEGRKVVMHDGDDIVAVDRETSEASPITREDIVLWKLDADRLFAGAASALDLIGTPSSVGMGNRLWWLGEFVPVEGERFPVYLATTRDANDLLKSTGIVSALSRRPFVLVTPSRRTVSDAVNSVVEGRGSAWITLDETLSWKGEGVFEAKRSLAQFLTALVQRHVQVAAQRTSVPRFPTPTGARWSDVRVRFTDGHTVSITVRDQQGTFDYASMGMGVTRTRKPNVQWALLFAFAKRRGILDWESGDASPKNQKRRERLAERLQAFFGIAGDPITPEGNGWRTLFRIDADH
ncbi:MAG TPA: hypothetical protein PKE29_02630 [Phycisphaerales bacterium]|nr:hypothetical protein [Phycisphaerales bacterium]